LEREAVANAGGVLSVGEAMSEAIVELLKNLRQSSGNAWDDVLDVRAELADMRGSDDADESQECEDSK
jgi:uncharacterized membrane protein